MKRVWKGYKEYCTEPYYVGQEYINEGDLKGCYRTLTNEFKTYDEASYALVFNPMDDEHGKKNPP